MEENRTDLSKVLSITGKPGLFKMVAQAKNGIIVESLIDGKRFQAFTHDKVSSLEEISVFTDTDDKPLRELLTAIKEKTNNGKAPDPKADNQSMKDFFESIMPDYDHDRVYVSHMKKIYAWYNLLHEKNMLDFIEKSEEAEEEGEEPSAENTTGEDKSSDSKPEKESGE
jgi:cobalamin biosynthesis protein CobT